MIVCRNRVTGEVCYRSCFRSTRDGPVADDEFGASLFAGMASADWEFEVVDDVENLPDRAAADDCQGGARVVPH